MPVTNAAVNLKRTVTLEQWQQITQLMGRLTFETDGKPLSKAERNFNRILRQKSIYPVNDQQRVRGLHARGTVAFGHVASPPGS